MDKNATIKMLQIKIIEGMFSIEEAKAIAEMAGLDLDKEIRIIDLLDKDNVKLYLELIETPEVVEYLELTKPATPVKGHIGPKNPMPCLLCSKNSHPIKWQRALVNGVDHWFGTLSEACSKYEGLKFSIQVGSKPTDYTGLPISTGQINGRSKSE